MEQANIIFNLDGVDIQISCSKEDKIRDICQKFASKIGKNLARFQFLYNGNILNLELSFKNQANRLDNSRNIMKVLVYPIEGSVIYFNNNNQNNDINNNNFQNKNVIRGILDIKLSEIKNNYVDLFFTVVKDGIDVYINHKKVNMIIREGHWKIDYFFERDGKYPFEIVMNFEIGMMACFFQECSNIISLDFTNFNTSYVKRMDFMFCKLEKLKEIKGLNKFITSNVKSMKGMFSMCRELEYLDLSNFDTSNVVNMTTMFYKCYKLKEIKGINKFITNKVIYMSSMFKFCTEIEYLDLSNFKTLNALSMEYMFSGCNKLKEIKGLVNFITYKVTSMAGLFQNCKELHYLNLSNFNTFNAIDIHCMFDGCTKLREIKGLDLFITNNVTNMAALFQLCENLQYLDLSNFNTSNVTDMSYMFAGCSNLKLIKGTELFDTYNLSLYLFII